MKIIYFVFILFVFNTIQAQVSTVDSLNKDFLNWYNKDIKLDKIQGASVERVYKELIKEKKTKKKIIVAVIDGGVDTAHADLKGKIWKNTDEIPDNYLDDDKNGYVDDIYGWNYIGNEKNENIIYDNYEYVRIYRDEKNIFDDIKSINDLPDLKQQEYTRFLICKSKYKENLLKYQTEKKFIESIENKLNTAEEKIKLYLGKESITANDLINIKTTDNEINNYKDFLLSINKSGLSRETINEIKKNNNKFLSKHLNIELYSRKIVGDNPEDINDNKYGNNDVKGPKSGHGTLAAGIIAACRNNYIGIDGIAENVEIMALRVVPEGDEYDKDVAFAIRYAVDNGANIINMSFGKAFSPQKKFVDDAIKYAGEHNVLLIHAAGNDGLNNDSVEHYPSKKLDDGKIAANMIVVGASSQKLDKNFVCFFSNYGQSVDIFAPGFNIISLLPENKYGMASGTSFSCPVVSGVAALIWSYFPDYTAVQIKDIILKSGTSYKNFKVYCPNKDKPYKSKIRYSKLCLTGAKIDTYKAFILAEEFYERKSK